MRSWPWWPTSEPTDLAAEHQPDGRTDPDTEKAESRKGCEGDQPASQMMAAVIRQLVPGQTPATGAGLCARGRLSARGG